MLLLYFPNSCSSSHHFGSGSHTYRQRESVWRENTWNEMRERTHNIQESIPTYQESLVLRVSWSFLSSLSGWPADLDVHRTRWLPFSTTSLTELTPSSPLEKQTLPLPCSRTPWFDLDSQSRSLAPRSHRTSRFFH